MTPQPSRSFSLPPPENVGARVTWELTGPVLDEDGAPHKSKTWAETFETIPAGTVPSAVLADLSIGVRIIDGQVRYETSNVLRFLRVTMRDADRARFDATCRDVRRGVHTSTLGDVAMYLVEELVRVPSGAPSNLPGGRSAREGSSGRGSGRKANGSKT